MRRILIAWVALAMAGGALADDIWGALALATNEKPPQPAPRALARFAPAIGEVFGYNSLYLLGQKKRSLDAWEEEWLVPSREFFFKVTPLAGETTRLRLRVELFRGKSQLLTTEVLLARDTPLYIRGPQWGDGQLVLILEVR